MTTIYAFANQKGGVGKTTTAINLAAFLAVKDKRVWLVDMDPQGNATSSLGVDKTAPMYSIYNALVDDVPFEDIVMLTKRPRLDLVPSSSALAGAEVELVAVNGRERLLANLLKPVCEKYDYILIDSPPSLGLLTLNALVAANAVIIPIQCEYLALEGLSQLLNTIHLVQEHLNQHLRVAGMAMTMFDSRTHLAIQVVEEVAKHFPDLIFHSVIPRSVRIAEAPSYGEPLVSFDPKSRGAQAYQALMEELLAREKPVNSQQ
ncbi:MAG: sporulation initiation inhibitor Soj [Chloroflexi bacterium RBG_16_56_8]|nr:MAG: sporulation initiation inhibitor Soj [Chloroflexi bacterium RBG_16_56_8]